MLVNPFSPGLLAVAGGKVLSEVEGQPEEAIVADGTFISGILDVTVLISLGLFAPDVIPGIAEEGTTRYRFILTPWEIGEDPMPLGAPVTGALLGEVGSFIGCCCCCSGGIVGEGELLS